MELKYNHCKIEFAHSASFNRTFMELKSIINQKTIKI